MIGEPRIHSHIVDCLPDDHNYAFVSVYCKRCCEMVHAFNNECMQSWVECGRGEYCLSCFIHVAGDVAVLVDDLGLRS